MPFQKGNKLAVGRTNPKDTILNNLLSYIGGGGAATYAELLERQSKGMKILDAQKEFMDRYQGLLEYRAPKLARTEVKNAEGEAFHIKVDI